MPALSLRDDHRPWTATTASARCRTPPHLGSPRDLPSMSEDLHHPTGMAVPIRAFHFAVSPAGLRANQRRPCGRAVSTALPRPLTLARSIYHTSMVLATMVECVVLGC